MCKKRSKNWLWLLFSSIHIHKAYSKTLKPQKIFISPFFEVLRLICDFQHFSRHFVRSEHNSLSAAQSHQWTCTIIAWKWLFWLLKSRWYLDNKLIAFSQFFSNGKPLKFGALLTYKVFCQFPAFPGFRFLPYSIFENPETTDNFHKLIFRGIKAIYLLLSTLLRILYVQNTIYKVLLKFINEHLLLLLESGFSGY